MHYTMKGKESGTSSGNCKQAWSQVLLQAIGYPSFVSQKERYHNRRQLQAGAADSSRQREFMCVERYLYCNRLQCSHGHIMEQHQEI